jgi:hypothetical protein
MELCWHLSTVKEVFKAFKATQAEARPLATGISNHIMSEVRAQTIKSHPSQWGFPFNASNYMKSSDLTEQVEITFALLYPALIDCFVRCFAYAHRHRHRFFRSYRR